VSFNDGFNTEDDSRLQGVIVTITKPFKSNRYKRPGPADQRILTVRKQTRPLTGMIDNTLAADHNGFCRPNIVVYIPRDMKNNPPYQAAEKMP